MLLRTTRVRCATRPVPTNDYSDLWPISGSSCESRTKRDIVGSALRSSDAALLMDASYRVAAGSIMLRGGERNTFPTHDAVRAAYRVFAKHNIHGD